MAKNTSANGGTTGKKAGELILSQTATNMPANGMLRGWTAWEFTFSTMAGDLPAPGGTTCKAAREFFTIATDRYFRSEYGNAAFWWAANKVSYD
jgi:hypothetical protein